jgi:hypothetical protein
VIQVETPAQLAAALGYEPSDPEWVATSVPPVPMERWGRDHWSTFAYAETGIVDHRGRLGHDHMRTHARRHPMLLAAKRRVSLASADGSAYPTRLKKALPLGQVTGEPQPVNLPDHDDYDCIDDAIAAGLLTVHMPRVAETGRYAGRLVDANGSPIPASAEFNPGFITGMEEQRLMAYAVFRLTPYGARVAAALREAIGAQVPASQFVPPAREE